jgi:hypothetical protein
LTDTQMISFTPFCFNSFAFLMIWGMWSCKDDTMDEYYNVKTSLL